MAEIGHAVAAKGAESLISRGWQEIQCLLNYNSNIKKLKETVEQLKSEEDTINQRVEVERRNALDIVPNVSRWLQEVNTTKQEVQNIIEETRNIQCGCLCCKCPKLHSRYKLSKRAFECTTKLIGLKGECKFEIIGLPAPPDQMPFISPNEFDGFESRIKILNEVMEALTDESITIIGMCGMPGVGKTTLAKEIADKVKVANLFDEVAWAVVSNDAVVEKVQDQLAESLGMNIEEKTSRGRAERLWTRLMNRDKRILVILDDLREKIHLHDMGIPVNGEGGGLKVLLTSRFLGVCSNMKAKPFQVDVLSEEESWHLFKKSAEISEEANEINDIAKQVAKECRGLPLAIVIVGRALKNKEYYAWRVALEELKAVSVSNTQDKDNVFFSKIKLSYNYLKDDSKFVLLLCSLFPEDFQIALEDLVRYAKGLQSSYLFKDVKTIAQVRDRVYTITDELKSCYLLLRGATEKHVKLHDVVRDACLTITSSGEHMHTVKHDGLKEWPQEDSCASSTVISLTFGEINQQLCSSLEEYPKLELLLLKFQRHKYLDMHAEFFKRMKEIKVLHLWHWNSKQIPSSLQSLVNLRTLCLDYCRLYGDLSVIGSQQKLEILSFYNSYLEHFPNNISKLSNLKSLDLRFNEGPLLPSGILVRLEKLEELYLGPYLQELEREGEEAYFVIINEISSLLNLQTLRFCAYDSRCLVEFLEKVCHPEKLMRFEITNIMYGGNNAGEYQLGKVLNLEDINVDLLKKNATQCLLQKTEDLTLKKVKGLTNVVSELDGKGFVNLKTLKLEGCCDLRYLVDATSFHTSCGLMRSCLLQLQEITINDCPKLETIVSNNKEGAKNHVEFPKLTYLNLRNLDSFRSFVPESSPSGALLEKIVLPNLEYLRINDINCIRCVVDGQMTFGSLSKLHHLGCYNCKSMEVVFDFKVLTYEQVQSLGSPLDQLEFLELRQLPKLMHIWRMLPQEIHAFKNLTSLSVIRCASFKYLLSPSMAKMLAGLEFLRLRDCEQMKAIIGVDEREIMEIQSTEYTVMKKEGNENTSKLEFPKLKKIEVDTLRNFQMLCSVNVELELPLLTELVIRDCPNVTKFCDGRLIAASLNKVDVKFKDDKKEVVLNEFSSWLK